MYDYIIVGAGSAGCVLASRLTEDPTCRVLLLEAGGPDTSPFSRIPGAYRQLQDTHYDWGYRTVPQPGLRNRRIFQPRGRVLGGSSAINFMVYVRGNRGDFDQWRDLGNDGWGYEDVLPYFTRMEHNERFQDEYHGSTGPFWVSDHAHRSPLSALFVEAAQEVGIPFNPDFNGASQEGCGYYQLAVRNNERCSAADAYLVPAMARSNLQVVTHALVTRVLIRNGAAEGVEYLTRDGLKQDGASEEVLLCAGAINSPQIMLLSGIGSAETLRQHCIAVQADLPGVGENLQDHLAPRIRCTTTVEHSFPALSDERRQAALGEYQTDRTGPLTSNFIEVGGFVRLDDEEAYPGLQLFFSSTLHSDYPEGPTQQSHGMTLSVYVARPRSRGRVTLATASPFDKALIDPNYLVDDYDVRGSVTGLKVCRRILAAKAFDAVRGTELLPERDIRDDAGLAEFTRRTAGTTWHLVGTCKMGIDDMAVVDPHLRVRGLDRLRVIDASVMPLMPTANTNAATMMIAEKASELIRGAAIP